MASRPIRDNKDVDDDNDNNDKDSIDGSLLLKSVLCEESSVVNKLT